MTTDICNGVVFKSAVHYDPTVVAYSSEHIPYIIVAMVVYFLLVICLAPLLRMYPTRLYEKFSQWCSPRQGIGTKTFAEALHRCLSL